MNNDMFRAADLAYESVITKLTYVASNHEESFGSNFRRIFNIPPFKSLIDIEEWKIKNIYKNKIRYNSYNIYINRIAKLPQVSIKKEELPYLEYFLLTNKLPVVSIDNQKFPESNGLNRKWETASLFIRLDKEVNEGKKFPELAKKYTEFMPEESFQKYGKVKPTKLRKSHSRGQVKASRNKTLY